MGSAVAVGSGVVVGSAVGAGVAVSLTPSAVTGAIRDARRMKIWRATMTRAARRDVRA
jgi:hypothetical protein